MQADPAYSVTVAVYMWGDYRGAYKQKAKLLGMLKKRDKPLIFSHPEGG